jgi:predicted RNase H-like nuclease (RuvC/YqgF family)
MQPNFFPNGINFPNMNFSQDIKNLENRVYNLEKEVTRLKNKLERLENLPMPLSDNYTSSYEANSYNMM